MLDDKNRAIFLVAQAQVHDYWLTYQGHTSPPTELRFTEFVGPCEEKRAIEEKRVMSLIQGKAMG